EPVPDLFSPNNDSRLDSTSIRYELDATVIATLDIQTPAGTLIRRLIDARTLNPGPAAMAWDGLTDAGQPAPDGSYEVTLKATLASDALVRQEEKVTLVLDRTPPQVTLTRPAGGFVQGTGSIVGTIGDARLAEFEVAMTATPATPNWEVLTSGNSSRIDAVLGSLQGRDEGEYALRIKARDEGESETLVLRPFVIDNTPPVVKLTTPENRLVASTRKGPVSITGSVEEKYLDHYQLRVGAGAQPTRSEEHTSELQSPDHL